MSDNEPNTTGNTYTGPVGQVGDRHIHTGGGDYYEGGTHHHHPQPVTWPLYINIPAPPTHFVGRDDLVHTLITQLSAGTTTALSAEGLPGVGKTSLAVKLAHHPDLRAHFTDGVLWAGLGPNGDPALALSRWADALHLDLKDKPTTATRAQTVADAISSRRLLIVLDDIWQLEHAQTLRLGGPASVHLLTTRDRRIAESFGHVATVDVLTPEAARALFQTLAPAAYTADPEAADALLDAVGYLPLAIELLAGYLKAGASRRFANRARQALDELTDPQRRLGLASERLGSRQTATSLPEKTIEYTLQQTIALSLEGLAEEEETAVAVFHALGAFAAKPARFDLNAAVAVTGATEDTLSLLADRNLLEIDDAGSLALHQTLADAARTHTLEDTVTQHRDHYIQRVDADREDWRTIQSIYPQLHWAWQQLPSNQNGRVAMANLLQIYQTRRCLWQDRLEWLQAGLIEAQFSGDLESQAKMLHNLGYVYDATGDKKQALHVLQQALEIRGSIADRVGEAASLVGIGKIHADLGERHEALRYFNLALPLTRSSGDTTGEATVLNNIGGIYSYLGKKLEAIKWYEMALHIRQSLNDREGASLVLNNIGKLYVDLSDSNKALGYLEQALDLRKDIGDRSGESTTLNNIGLVYHACGNKNIALYYFEQSLALKREVGDRSGQATAFNNIGLVHDDLGDKQDALHYYEQALYSYRAVGDRSGESTTLNNIGRVYHALGDKTEALKHYEQALSQTQDVGDRFGEATTLSNIGAIYYELGEKQEALRYFKQALPLRRAVGDRSGEATTLNNIAFIYVENKNLPRAAQILEEVATVFSQINNAPAESAARFNLAVVQDRLGDLLPAMVNLEQSTAILKRLNLNQDAAGRTRQQHEDLLAQLKARSGEQ